MVDLRKIPLFQDLSKEEMEVLQRGVREKTFQKGEIINHEGQGCESVFVVVEGKVKLCRTSSAGREQVLEMLDRCDTCACNPGAANWTCPMTAQAATPCKILYFPRADYARLVEQNTKFSRQMSMLFAQRLQRFSALIEQVSLDDVHKRLAKFLLDMLAKNKKAANEKVLFIPFTRQDLAERLGAARETVARHLSQLRKQKLIDIKPYQIIIRDKEGLEKIAK